ncbi:MAG: hypothetical protein EOM25_03345 [Deltaproteobacteria bacterium]|nr:hypothetical protein [Deltaproteobacteria bacterium]
MKIHPELIQGVQDHQADRKVRRPENDLFADLLNEKIAKSEKAAGPDPASVPSAPLAPGLLDIREVQAVEGVSSGREVMNSVDSLLDQWDRYAQGLQAPRPDLKSAYAQLKSIAENVQEVKKAMPEAGSPSVLKDMVEELDIMAVTEEIRINRGDYSPLI